MQTVNEVEIANPSSISMSSSGTLRNGDAVLLAEVSFHTVRVTRPESDTGCPKPVGGGFNVFWGVRLRRRGWPGHLHETRCLPSAVGHFEHSMLLLLVPSAQHEHLVSLWG